MTYNFGDIVFVGFPHSDLEGITKRPAVVLYDSGDQDVLVARITTQDYSSETDYKIADWKKCGLLAASTLRLSKQATIEKRFILRKLGKLEPDEVLKVKSLLIKIFS
jgi:mRNA interferase MazF